MTRSHRLISGFGNTIPRWITISVVHLLNPSRLQLQRLRAYYAANVSMIDKQVGQIMEALEEQGYLDNSIVIFTSDHGDCLGDHGQIQKWTMYDIITRVPAIVWAPGRFPAGERIGAQCQWMDIGRTVLELAGVTPAEDMQAVSLLPALRGEEWRGREYVFAEHPADGNYQGPYMTMIRSAPFQAGALPWRGVRAAFRHGGGPG